MKQDDLTAIKYVGLTRMRILKDSGITHIKQLDEMPWQKLAAIKTIGEHSAKLIKKSASEYYREKHAKFPDKGASAQKMKKPEDQPRFKKAN